MGTIDGRKKDILKLISKLDITPTMFKNADEKYRNLAEFLAEHGIEADFYPQGSFALGTVIRPSVKDPNAAYDLDAICQIKAMKDDTSPSALWWMVQNALESIVVYKSRLKVYDKCLTIEYADIGEYGFSIDIVPAADEAESKKDELRSQSATPWLMETAIAIPKKTVTGHRWITNNPKGYRDWFDDVNAPFAAFSRREFRFDLFENNTDIYKSVEEIPQGLERSSVQRVIQILKYHRDVFYSKRKDGDDIKPIPAIINTVVASVAKSVSPTISVFDLLDVVTEELEIYAKQQGMNESLFRKSHIGKNIIQKINGRWIITNPANPQDNLADAWNNNKDIPFMFFQWAKMVREDLIESLRLDESDFRTSIENAFGPERVQKTWGNRYIASVPKPVNHVSPAKPWRDA